MPRKPKMSSRQQGYYGPSDADLDKGALGCLACFALPVLIAVGCGLAALMGCTPAPDAPGPATGNAVLLDTSDAPAMHALGLPTRADMMAYAACGRWGWGESIDGTYAVHAYEAVPGSDDAWLALYGLEPADRG